MNSPTLLTNFELCDRKGYFSRLWEPLKLRTTRMMAEAIRQAVMATGQQDWGVLAGSAMLQLAQDRGLEREETHKQYQSIIHHAALADLIVTLIRKPNDPPWITPESVQNWTPDCYLSADGQYLRRIVLVTHWTDDRHVSEVRSWFTLGEMAHYGLPLQLIICVLGQQRDGLRVASPWTSGFLHPGNHDLRFRKRKAGVRQEGNVFGENWVKIYREDHDEISREKWLEAMLRDDVLNDVIFREDIPVPPLPHLQRARRMAAAKLERLYALRHTPEANLSSCDWPVVCPFRHLCHTLPEVEPEEKYGFIRIESRTPDPTAYIPTSRRTSADHDSLVP